MTDWDNITNFNLSEKPLDSVNIKEFLKKLEMILADTLHEDLKTIMEKVNIILGDNYKWQINK